MIQKVNIFVDVVMGDPPCQAFKDFYSFSQSQREVLPIFFKTFVSYNCIKDLYFLTVSKRGFTNEI